MVDGTDDDAGPLAAGEARERDAQANDGSLRCSGTAPGDHDKNHDHAGGNSINRFMLPLSGNWAKSDPCSWMCIDSVIGLRLRRSLKRAEYRGAGSKPTQICTPRCE